MHEDVTIAHLEGGSNSLWTISPPSRQNLITILNQNSEFHLTMTWTVQRYGTAYNLLIVYIDLAANPLLQILKSV